MTAVPEKDAAYASFEQKWLDANPEQNAVSIFLAPARRKKLSAFGTLIHEITLTAFSVRETAVAAAKLGWWQQELASAASGHSRHPISRELFRTSATSSIDVASWRKLIDGALAQLDAPAAAAFDDLRKRLAEFYGPVAAVESQLNDHRCDDGASALWISSHLVAMFRSTTPDHLDLPLDLLARHGTSRTDLALPGPKQSAVTKDFLGQTRELIAQNLNADVSATISRRVRARLDLRLVDGAIRSNDPAHYIATRYHRTGWRSAWLSWREARAEQKRHA